MKIIEETKLDFDDVLIRPQRSTIKSRADVDIYRKLKFYHSPREIEVFPVCCSNMTSIASLSMGLALQKYKIITCLHKYIPYTTLVNHFKSQWVYKDYNWISIGHSDTELSRLKSIVSLLDFAPNICIDCANGHREDFVSYCKSVRDLFPESIIMAGNVGIPECVSELILHGGVDLCKIQIGNGKNCLTRMITGVGYPSISCIDECSTIAHGLKSKDRCLGLVVSDGGCKNPGDVCKALVAGADIVMLGSIFSATDETEQEIIEKDGKKYMMIYGESTHYAQEKFAIGKKIYRASEGKITYVEHKGSVEPIVQELIGAVRSTCTYTGSTSVKDLNKCGQFVKVNRIHQDYTNRFGD